MNRKARFPYVTASGTASGKSELQPYLPICLFGRGMPIEAYGLVDSVRRQTFCPYGVGVNLGLNWSKGISCGPIKGAFACDQSRAANVLCKVGQFKSVNLIFAWVDSDDVPLILGQTDFFLFYNVCFFASEKAFEITLKN